MKHFYFLIFCVFGFLQLDSSASQVALGTAGLLAVGAYSAVETGEAAWKTEFNKKYFGKMVAASVVASIIAAATGAEGAAIPFGIFAVSAGASLTCSVVDCIQFWRTMLKSVNRLVDGLVGESKENHDDGLWDSARSWIVSHVMASVYGAVAAGAFCALSIAIDNDR